jgi:choline dehydrogenase-like flavoprotein
MATEHEVLIIGSGASGGMMARTLTAKGIRCLMLDAGPPVDFERDRTTRNVYDLPYRGFGQPGRFPHITQANEFNGNVWADERLNPYSYDADSPYYWVRVRRIGGRSLMWGRASWRLSDFEFKCKDHDGFGENWPVSYKDLAPYYDKVEPILRVSGRNEGLPQLPDGIFIDDGYNPSHSILRFNETAKKKGIPTTQPRRATGQMASSVNLMLPDALATGNLKIVSDAVVREITTDPKTGLANGAHFVDRRSKREYHVNARAVVVGASTLETTRLLLNSKLANSSGVLGHYLFDQFYIKNVVVASVPEARGGKAPRGLMGGSGYIPRFRNLTNKESKFIRGYAYDFSSGGTPGTEYIPLYGDELKRELANLEGSAFHMTTMGEVLPRRENAVRIDKNKVDAWGIPVLHIQHRYTDNEFEMAKDAMQTADELCHESGFQVLAKHWEMVPPGESIHELGTCRMGTDPKTSVLNGFNQTHDVKNLFVVDGSAFVSGGSQNPTLTICALSMRAGDRIAERMRARDI